jgi:hypothetical protein
MSDSKHETNVSDDTKVRSAFSRNLTVATTPDDKLHFITRNLQEVIDEEALVKVVNERALKVCMHMHICVWKNCGEGRTVLSCVSCVCLVRAQPFLWLGTFLICDAHNLLASLD